MDTENRVDYVKVSRFPQTLCALTNMSVGDRIFGTTVARIESIPANIDYVNQARMPLF